VLALYQVKINFWSCMKQDSFFLFLFFFNFTLTLEHFHFFNFFFFCFDRLNLKQHQLISASLHKTRPSIVLLSTLNITSNFLFIFYISYSFFFQNNKYYCFIQINQDYDISLVPVKCNLTATR
jgi:hypothetical protein